MMQRRQFGVTKRAVLGLAAGVAASGLARAQTTVPAVKLALVVPLSGPWATIGLTIKDGVDFAVADVNAAGGIKALGGAKLELVTADAEDSAEKAKSAAERLFSREPTLSGGMGDALSGMTLVVSELADRAGMAWITQTFADSLTERGLRNFFEAVPVASVQAREALPTVLDLARAATGKAPASVAVIADTNQAIQSMAKTWRDGEFAKHGVKLLSERSYTPPLQDPTELIEGLRRNRPDFLFLLPSNLSDLKLMLDKMNEFGLGRGRLPVVAVAGTSGTPDLLKVAGAEVLENLCGIFGNWPGRDLAGLQDRFKARSGKPWMTGQVLDGYGQVMIFRDALEAAGSADKAKVAAAIRTADMAGASRFYNGKLGWDATGRRTDNKLVVIQWQGGQPRAVFPPSHATAKVVWR